MTLPAPDDPGALRRPPGVLPMTTSTRTPLRATVVWSVSTLLALPPAGYLGTAIVGRVDATLPALVGGAVVGALVGLVQALGSSGRLAPLAWTLAGATGLGVGTLLGSLATDFGTSLPDLALRGLIAGTVLGLAQVLALPRRTRARWTWVPATAALVSLGWTVTTLAGIDVDRQYISFGASGALVYGVLSGLTLLALLPVTTSPRRTAAEGASRR